MLAGSVRIEADRAEALRPGQGAKSNRRFLLDLGHPDGPLGQVVRERQRQVTRKAQQHLLRMIAPAPQQMERIRLLGPCALARLLDALRGQLAQQMCIAQRMHALDQPVWRPAVMRQHAGAVLQNTERIDCLDAPRLGCTPYQVCFGVTLVCSHCNLACTRFIDMNHRRLAHLLRAWTEGLSSASASRAQPCSVPGEILDSRDSNSWTRVTNCPIILLVTQR